MTALNASRLTTGDLTTWVVVAGGLLLIACVATTLERLWGPHVHSPAKPGLLVDDELELPPYAVIHETCPNPGCDERVCYCPVTDGLPCVGTVDPVHTHQMTRRPA